jgi:hypothetical protein
MSDPFESSKFSIAWAKDHIAELDREVDIFLKDENSCVPVTEPNANGTHNLLKLKFPKTMPRPLRGHASDSAINLRNALDQAVCSVCAINSLPTHNRYFPIGNTVRDFKNALKGRCGDFPQEIRNVIRRAQPYKRGNPLLWALNKLSGTNKHSILRPVLPSTILIEGTVFGVGLGTYDPPRWNSDKNEMVLASVPIGSKFDMKYQSSFFVAFNEIELLDGQEVLAVLNKMADMVECVVMAIEAEAKRIGLV